MAFSERKPGGRAGKKNFRGGPARSGRPFGKSSGKPFGGRPAQGGKPRQGVVRREDSKFMPAFLIEHLAGALRSVLKLDGPADVLLSVYFKKNHSLGSRDRGFVAESVYFTLRHLAEITWAMAPAVPARSPRLAALVTVAMTEGPERIAPSDLKGDEKALKSIIEKLASKDMPAEVRAELPEWLYGRITEQYDDAERFFREIALGAPLDIRVNLLKAARKDVLDQLEESGAKAVPTPYSPDGIRFLDKPGITGWPVYRDGLVDVQDEGSQLIARLLAPRRREMICDFCAGAGGKTLAIGALMRSTGRLYAFDVNDKRLSGMVPRLRRSGLSNVTPIAIRDEHDRRLGRLIGKFDRVLVDAPCTGTGTLRRNPDLRWRLSEAELERINAIQKSVIRSAARLVKKGGRLVYATCSVLREENQDVVNEFLAEHPEFRLVNSAAVLESQGVRFTDDEKARMGDWFVMLPQTTATDGFFGAVLEKTEDAPRRKKEAETEAKTQPEAAPEAEEAQTESAS